MAAHLRAIKEEKTVSKTRKKSPRTKEAAAIIERLDKEK